MLFLRVLTLLSLFAANIRASSHWMVTETGLIQSKDESPFAMSRPFDLLSFLNQETRWQNTFNIYDDLVTRQKIINGLWAELEEQSDITSHVIGNEYCKAVGDIESVDWYTAVVEDGKSLGIYEREFMLYAIEEFGQTEVPDCKKISSLIFSMATFEHLEGMMNRGHLNATPETTLPEIFSSVRTVDQYGHWLSEVLRRNTTSWLHYNLAAIFWRLKGNASKALECSRRAVHYAPRHYKTIPLLCMGSILHRSKKTEDAIIVLGASVDHAPTLPLNHFALGEAYAVAGDFNSSVKHLNMSIKLHEGFALATKYQKAVFCHIDMLTKMQYAQRTLNKIGVELQEFHEMETKWFKIHATILKSMKHNTEFSQTNIEKSCIKMEELTHLKIKDLYTDRDRNALIHFIAANTQYTEDWKKENGVYALQIAYELERAVQRAVKQSAPVNKSLMGYNSQIERNKTEILEEIGPVPTFPDILPEPMKFSDIGESGVHGHEDMKTFTLPVLPFTEQIELAMIKQTDGKVLYPSKMKLSRNKMDFDTETDWPSIEFCEEAKPSFPDIMNTVYPVFMPFEHKGISVQFLLTEKIGVPALEEHELPWHPPLCPNDKDLALYTSKKGIKIQLAPEAIADEYLRFKLLTYVSHIDYEVIKTMQDAEIGQRIHAAMQKKLAPKWILYTLASLYWRVRANSVNALNCLLSAHRSDSKHQDVALVSLASVLLEMGLMEEALSYAEEAYRLSPYEPPTNFLLAQVHMLRKQQRAHFFHLKQVLRVDPQYMNGRARTLLNCWACIAKQVNTLKELGDMDSEKDICAEMEPGVSMVCERDGTNCRLASGQCSRTDGESGTLVRMLELKDDSMQASMFSHRHLESSFQRALNAKPLERHDKAGHLRSYELMMKAVAEQIVLCKKKECGEMLHILHLKKEECEYNHMFESSYWLHFVSFQQELSESERKILADIASMTPSHKKTPECVVPLAAEGDFFLSRVLAADTTGWGALLALIQHFTELFNQHDYALFGAKLAKYVDTHGGSWWGALVAGWWCGAVGRGACAVRCLAAAHALAPHHSPHHSPLALRPLIALLLLQNKNKDAMDIAYLSFYATPKSKVEAFLVGISHFYNHEIDGALWMYRYSLAYDNSYIPATAFLHTALCQIAFNKDEDLTKETPNKLYISHF